MRNAKKEFFSEINDMINKWQYNEKTMDRLIYLIVGLQLLAERETNEDVKKTLLQAIVVGERLAKKLYAIRKV